MPLFLTVAEIYGRKSRNSGTKLRFSTFLAHPVETLCTIFMVPHQNVRRSSGVAPIGPGRALART